MHYARHILSMTLDTQASGAVGGGIDHWCWNHWNGCCRIWSSKARLQLRQMLRKKMGWRLKRSQMSPARIYFACVCLWILEVMFYEKKEKKLTVSTFTLFKVDYQRSPQGCFFSQEEAVEQSCRLKVLEGHAKLLMAPNTHIEVLAMAAKPAFNI